MKTTTRLALLGFLSLIALTSSSFAMISFRYTSPEQAKEMGIKVKHKPSGPDHVIVDIEFKPEGRLKNFAKAEGLTRVDLQIGEDKERLLSATLREDRSQKGRVAVRFTAKRSQLDQITVWLIDPPLLGGTAEVLKLHQFIDLERIDHAKNGRPVQNAEESRDHAPAKGKAED